ncbi:MAG: hypothetical protein HYV63_09440 [Candidatus Schekmanbacteria bacterium]|nr:hypothetical protein [Candidatus Schekmanbacteria bacterium]
MATYYKTIDGVRYDRELLEKAEVAVAGRGDGRISRADAEMLLAAVKDGDSYTEVEKVTVEYLQKSFTWTADADRWFREQLATWQAGARRS